jgi:CMP-N-acetylneuraminic acid synthetase
MKICGILITKEESKRFPEKNRKLFEHNLDIMINTVGHENVFMFTDDEYIAKVCFSKEVSVIRKRTNIDDEMSYLDVLRYAYMSIDEKYDVIVTVQCNSIGNIANDIFRAIDALKLDPHIVEVRSFNDHGKQSGIFAFKSGLIPEKWHHQAIIITNGKEIHYESELEG